MSRTEQEWQARERELLEKNNELLERARATEGKKAHVEIVRIGEVLDEGDGFWRSCCGCHELNDGAPTGEYSAAFRAYVGCGCSECGGIGVVWDPTDYADMADFVLAEVGSKACAEAAETDGDALKAALREISGLVSAPNSSDTCARLRRARGIAISALASTGDHTNLPAPSSIEGAI